MAEEVGSLGLPFTEIGDAVQSLASVLVDRGHDKDRVIHQLIDGRNHAWFNEPEFWEQVLGPATDELARWLDLPPFPEEEAE